MPDKIKTVQNSSKSWTRTMLDKHVPAPRLASEDETQEQGDQS